MIIKRTASANTPRAASWVPDPWGWNAAAPMADFLYVRDPDGHRIEIYCSDYQTCDPDLEPIKWDLKDPQRQTLWGAPAPRSWFEEGSLFTGITPQEAALKASPIIAP